MELPMPITVHNVDGTKNKQGKLTHYCWLWIVKGEKGKLQQFYITSLEKDRIILGYPVLYEFNPVINWRNGKIMGAPVQLQSSVAAATRVQASHSRAGFSQTCQLAESNQAIFSGPPSHTNQADRLSVPRTQLWLRAD